MVAQHEHDDEVGSFAIERDGDVDPERLNAWLSKLLREHGIDIFRMKGFLALAGEPSDTCFRACTCSSTLNDKPWDGARRQNQPRFHRSATR